MDDANCDGCFYAVPKVMANVEPDMQCRRFPPNVLIDEDGDVFQMFPNAWVRCGEYSTKRRRR